MNAQEKGSKGERLAREAYEKRGYQLVQANYRTRRGEIDIIVTKNDVLVFVEVKTRSSTSQMLPREWVDAGKQKKIILAAQQYVAEHSFCSEMSMRFDVAEIIFEDDTLYTFNMIENAFTL